MVNSIFLAAPDFLGICANYIPSAVYNPVYMEVLQDFKASSVYFDSVFIMGQLCCDAEF
ncbi:MAG: hypothetical protein PHC34_11610 [Candidatus Gastranaerophilales bacterium]|nr:hypothetical protein [Candidatus Gastranaerophilales bacterium]